MSQFDVKILFLCYTNWWGGGAQVFELVPDAETNS